VSKSPPKPQREQSQRDRFVETARALECDEDKRRFEDNLGQIARAKPAAKPAAKPKPERE
jgi:hypothetical protein